MEQQAAQDDNPPILPFLPGALQFEMFQATHGLTGFNPDIIMVGGGVDVQEMTLQWIFIAYFRATFHFDISMAMSTVLPCAPDDVPTRGHQDCTYIALNLPHANIHVKSACRLFKNVWTVHLTRCSGPLTFLRDLPR